MTNKFDNLINSTFASLIKEQGGVEPEEVAQNPQLALQQQAQTIEGSGGPKNAKETELVKKAALLKKTGAKDASKKLRDVSDAEQAQKDVQL